MVELRFLNYFCDYGYSLDGDNVAEENLKFPGEAVCFGELFHKISGDRHYDATCVIYMYRDKDAVTKCKWKNYCIFKWSEVIQHLMSAQNLCPFTFKLESAVRTHKDVEYSCYRLTLHFKQATCLQIKYTLTWARYLYETPFCFMAWDAMMLRKEFPLFKFTSRLNIVNFVFFACGFNMQDRDVHTLIRLTNHTYRPITFESNKLYKETLATLKRETLQSVFNTNKQWESHINDVRPLAIKDVDSMDNWKSEFPARLDSYRKIFEILNTMP